MSVFIPYALTQNETAMLNRRKAWLRPLTVLARQKKMWSLPLLAGALWRVVANIGRHGRVLKVVRLPEYAILVQGDARFAFKYLTRGYLSRNLTVAERAACFERHYLRLHELLPRAVLLSILNRDETLLAFEEQESRYAVTLGLPRDHDKEGELSLNLVVNGQTVYILSFTIVTGSALHSSAEDVFLISRIQGVKGFYKQIQSATKALHDVAPGALLVAALQGLGEALHIEAMACIRAQDQNSYCVDYDRSFRANYDDFFTELGAKKNEAEVYLASIPLREKPMLQIKPGHKLRTREKREFKREIAQKVEERMRERCRGRGRAASQTLLAPAVKAI